MVNQHSKGEIKRATFKGYLLKALKTGAIFPNAFIEIASFDSTPNAREEIKAERDDYTRDLIRVTAAGTKSSMSFNTMALHLNELESVLGFFTSGEEPADKLQRKIHLEYWNDEDLAYKQGWFYRPNIKYTKREISNDDIIYEPIKIELVEY